MSDISINMSRALQSESYAAKLIRSGKLNASQRCQIVSQWGADKVKTWESVDSTKYMIDDDDFDKARSDGKKNTADKVGYDGSKDHGAWTDVAGGAATVAATAAAKEVGKKVIGAAANKAVKKAMGALTGKAAQKAANDAAQKFAGKIIGKKSAEKAAEKGGQELGKKVAKNVGAWVAVTLGAAEATKYLVEKPNKEQVESLDKMRDQELPSANNELLYTQSDMQAATEEVIEIGDEAAAANEDANESMAEDKTLFDFYRAQYTDLKTRAEGGEQLNPDQKALLQKLAPVMEGLATNIEDTSEEVQDNVGTLYDDMGEYQSRYDDGAETIGNVQGVTDFAEGYDESTKIMSYVEGAGQTLNAGSSAIATAQLISTNVFGINTAFIALGTYATAVSGTGAKQQMFDYAPRVDAEIQAREAVQGVGEETQTVYEEESDNFAVSLETVEDLEIEVPEDTEIPEAPVIPTTTNNTGANGTNGNASNSPLLAGSNGGTGGTNGTGNNNPFLTGGTNGAGNTGGTNGTNGSGNTGGANGTNNDDDDSTSGTRSSSPSGIPNVNDPNYVNRMGNGSDWTDVANGNIKRNSNSDIVVDEKGKVVLIGTYADAIKSVTDAEEGEYFSKTYIPKILEKVLGAPFDEKTIKKVHDGKKVDSEFAAKILKVTSDSKGNTEVKETGETKNVDNTDKATQIAKRVVDFYYPIFEKASEKGWVRG